MKFKFNHINISTFVTFINSILFFFFFLIMIIVINLVMKRYALSEAENKAKVLLDHNLAVHQYFNQTLKPDMFSYLESLGKKNDTIIFNPVWMSSTYAIRGINKYFDEIDKSDYYYKECAINARSPENEADSYEMDFIKRLNSDKNIQIHSGIREIDRRLFFTVLRRGESMESSCLRCHSTPDKTPRGLVEHYGPVRSFNRYTGETVSAISIRIPLTDAYDHANTVSFQLSGVLVIFMMLLFAVQKKIFYRYVFVPVNSIRERAAAAAGNLFHPWEEVTLPFGKELSALTSDFNIMARSLLENRQVLEKSVQERTRELETSNSLLLEEIEQRKAVETELKNSLDEKETLMKEIHHRVKNNFQMVMSLIDMQGSEVNDTALAGKLSDLVNRIRSMSMVHEKLYLSKNISRINFAEYLKNISEEIRESRSVVNKSITIRVISEEVFIDIDQAIPCGLLVNEIITNSMKHAFPLNTPGEIVITLTMGTGNEAELMISDNGIGLSKEKKPDAKSFGMELIRHIVKNQLNGEYIINEDGGTSYLIKFKVKKAKG